MLWPHLWQDFIGIYARFVNGREDERSFIKTEHVAIFLHKPRAKVFILPGATHTHIHTEVGKSNPMNGTEDGKVMHANEQSSMVIT